MIEAMKQVLEVLEENLFWFSTDTMIGKALRKKTESAIATQRQAIAEAEKQEPVSFKDENGNVLMILDASKPIGYVYSIHGERIKGAAIDSKIPNGTPIYIHPQLKRQWVGLTDKERTQLVVEASGWNNPTSGFFSVARAIEAKLKEKNT